ncbi:hypothetical protein BDV93DRAFT_564390 [Ceratobasidium sp. AG-I]|nr:hypothetical protein BDV93DRAFT_564390 [Ceratobasidium sp. AG-I]
MFNRPKCWYPASMAHTYMRSHNVTDATNYAVPMSSLVQRLPKLEILHLGDYHTNFSAVMIHRMNHQKYYPTRNQPNNFDPTVHTAGEDDDGPPVNDNVPPLAPRGPWDPHCPTCKQRFASKTEEAERRAVAVLATRVWSLRTISFASFFSDRCVGPSSWEIRRRGEDASGKLLSPEATQELGSGDAVSGQLRVETFRANNRRTIREEMFERREVGWSVVD